MTSSISELIEGQRERQRLENEVEIAREVQQQLFPQYDSVAARALSLPLSAGPLAWSAAITTISSRSRPTRVGIALADISGKGIFAALLMASLQAALRSTASLEG